MYPNKTNLIKTWKEEQRTIGIYTHFFITKNSLVPGIEDQKFSQTCVKKLQKKKFKRG